MPEHLAEASCRNCVHKAAPRALPGWLAACALIAAGAVALPETSRAESDPYAPKWNPWAELGGYWGSDDSSHGVGELWAPLLQGPNSLFFLDARFQLFEEDVSEGNLALGLRKMTPSGWNLGIWGGLDVRSTEIDNSFWQLSGGLEALSVKWDARVNGYVPTTDPQASPELAEVKLRGNNIFMIGGEEVALYGVDGEVGYLLFGSPQTKQGTRHELRIYGGGFWFDHSDAIHEVAGPKARVEWRIDDVLAKWAGSRLTFETEYSNDEVRDDRWEVGLKFRIPFGGTEQAYAGLTPQERRMMERIYRDDDIITVQSGPENVRDALTDVLFERVAHVNPSITEVSAKAGDNSLLIVNGTVTGPQQLQGNQTLQGGKSTIQVQGVKSGTVAPFTAPGAKAHLNDPGDATNLTLLGSNTHIAGLNIQGAGSGVGEHGIFGGSDKNNIVIEQTSINDVNIHGIHFNNNNRNVTISGTTITKAGDSGIFFGNLNSNVTIANTAITDTGGDSIAFLDGNQNVTIFGVDINNSSFHGIFFNNGNSNVAISGATVTDVDGDGIQFNNFNTNVTIAGTTITDVGNNGIHFVDGNRNVTIANTTVTGAAEYGIRFEDENSDVTITHTTVADIDDRDNIGFGNRNSNVTIAHTAVINNNSLNGILFESGNRNISIVNTTIRGTRNNGISFFDDNVNVTIANTTITNVAEDGIEFGSRNSGTIADTSITNADADGIQLGDGNTIGIVRTSITNTGDDGIQFGGGNTIDIVRTSIADVDFGIFFFGTGNNVTIADTTITDAADDGLLVGGGGHTIAMDRTVFSGNFGEVIEIVGGSNTLSGANNSAANATYTDFCDALPQANGSFFAFDDIGTGTGSPGGPGTCPETP